MHLDTDRDLQFAKEAMAYQCLDHNEVLNVRWAMPDPNPTTRVGQEREIEEQAADAIRAALAVRPDPELPFTEEHELPGAGESRSPEESGDRDILPKGTLQAMKDFSVNFRVESKRPARKRKLVEYASDEEEE